MKIRALTLLILELNHLVDSGKYSQISISDVHREIEKKNVLAYLDKVAETDIDISILLDSTAYKSFGPEYEDRIYDIYGGYAGQERRKWGVEKSGLCLLIAWTNEIIQRGDDLEW